MVDVVSNSERRAFVACPWCKLKPQRWLIDRVCQYRKPWANLQALLRHHTITSHQKINERLLEDNDPDAVNDGVFKDLTDWFAVKKRWNSPEHRIARWFEVCAIIAKWLDIELPDDLHPEWTPEWARTALSQGQPLEDIQHAIAASEDTRREAQALVNHINDKKRSHQRAVRPLLESSAKAHAHAAKAHAHTAKAHAYAARLSQQIKELETQYELELEVLKASLRQKVLPHDYAPEFLVQIEREEFAAASASTHEPVDVGWPNNMVQPDLPSTRAGVIEVDNSISTDSDLMYNPLQSSSLALQEQRQRPNSFDSSDDQSSWNMSTYFGNTNHSTISTSSNIQDCGDDLVTMDRDMGGPEVLPLTRGNPYDPEDFPESMNGTTYSNILANADFGPDLMYE